MTYFCQNLSTCYFFFEKNWISIFWIPLFSGIAGWGLPTKTTAGWLQLPFPLSAVRSMLCSGTFTHTCAERPLTQKAKWFIYFCSQPQTNKQRKRQANKTKNRTGKTNWFKTHSRLRTRTRWKYLTLAKVLFNWKRKTVNFWQTNTRI